MQLTGNHRFEAAPSQIWPLLMDTDTLARIVPGMQKLEKVEEGSYKSTLGVKLGPVNAAFTGQLQMEEVKEQEGFTLKVQQNSKVGNASAAIGIQLTPTAEGGTEVSFDGDVKLSGMLASMGQRLIGSVASTLSKQFFSNMEKELAQLST
ncbi:MAG TPA: carbon monoxide dehydrogenase subunit G [Phnomibacter sp.]|nr:carbon monoxide dehydrogenase subunit G [Phnomibacter sp.]